MWPFGAFVDVGVHQDGLVHVSAMADRFVSDPHGVVRSGRVVRVKVVEVDTERKRIGLTLRLGEQTRGPAKPGRGARIRAGATAGRATAGRAAASRAGGGRPTRSGRAVPPSSVRAVRPSARCGPPRRRRPQGSMAQALRDVGFER